MVRYAKACISIIIRVVLSLVTSVSKVKRAYPLNGMTYTFRMSKRTTNLSPTNGITRTPSGTSNVNASRTFLFTFITRCRRTMIIPTFIGDRYTRMRPYTTSCLLIRLRLHSTSVIGCGVFNVTCTTQRYLMECMCDVFSHFQGVKCPFNGDLIFLLFDFNGTYHTKRREIFVILVSSFPLNGSKSKNLFPAYFPTFRIRVGKALSSVSTRTAIVICSSFLLLHIPFTKDRCVNSYVLWRKRRMKRSRKLNRLIFYDTRRPQTLPSPFILIVSVVFPITLPGNSITSFRSTNSIMKTQNANCPKNAFMFRITRRAYLIFLPFPMRIKSGLFSTLPIDGSNRIRVIRQS